MNDIFSEKQHWSASLYDMAINEIENDFGFVEKLSYTALQLI